MSGGHQYDGLYRLGLKYEVMEHYSKGSPCCAECGCSDLYILQLDHINNDGSEVRRRFTSGRGGIDYWLYLRRQGYPDDLNLQVLCNKCNNRKPRQKANLSHITVSIEFDWNNPIPDAQPQPLWEVSNDQVRG